MIDKIKCENENDDVDNYIVNNEFFEFFLQKNREIFLNRVVFDRNVVANVNHVLKQIFLFNILKLIIE